MIGEELATSLGNLAESVTRGEEERLFRRGHLSELARSTSLHLIKAGEAGDPRSFFAAAGELLRDTVVSHLDAADLSELSLLLLSEAERLWGERPRPEQLGGGPVPATERSRVVYVRNPLSDTAYDRFSRILTAPTVGYRQNFRELFDDVENGYADYAVLPVRSGGVMIPSVSALIEERGLAVASVTRIPSEDEVLFALLSREAVALCPPSSFLLRLRLGAEKAPIALFRALAAFGLSLAHLEMRPVPYEEGILAARLLVDVGGGGLSAFLAYLALYAPDWMGYGYFTEIP